MRSNGKRWRAEYCFHMKAKFLHQESELHLYGLIHAEPNFYFYFFYPVNDTFTNRISRSAPPDRSQRVFMDREEVGGLQGPQLGPL